MPEVNHIYLSAHKRLHSGPFDLARPIARVSDYEGRPQAMPGGSRVHITTRFTFHRECHEPQRVDPLRLVGPSWTQTSLNRSPSLVSPRRTRALVVAWIPTRRSPLMEWPFLCSPHRAPINNLRSGGVRVLFLLQTTLLLLLLKIPKFRSLALQGRTLRRAEVT